MAEVTGDLLEPGEVRGEWRISNFPSLPEEVGKAYWSPNFLFLDSCWCLQIYPYGEIKNSEGWIELYLLRLNHHSPVTVSFSFTTRIADKEQKKGSTNRTFTSKDRCWGWDRFLMRSDLQSGKRAVSPSDVLTVSYIVKSVDRQPAESTLCSRLWRTSLRWNDTLCTQKRTYVTLKLKEDKKIWAHKAILESSSPVFARIFGVDMRESQTGKFILDDVAKSTFQVALFFIYTGDPKGLGVENVCEVYKVAHKYEFQELREFCAKFMKNTLCVDTVCDVIALADLYQEKVLMESAKNYFAKNKTGIFKTEEWKTFRRDNSTIACQILEYVLVRDV